MKGAIGDLMKQAQRMQEDVQRVQEEIAASEVTGEAGGGMVKVTLDGRYGARKVSIDPALLSEDQGMLEDLIAAAMNDAVRRVGTLTQEKMSGVTAGMELPPGFKMPFS